MTSLSDADVQRTLHRFQDRFLTKAIDIANSYLDSHHDYLIAHKGKIIEVNLTLDNVDMADAYILLDTIATLLWQKNLYCVYDLVTRRSHFKKDKRKHTVEAYMKYDFVFTLRMFYEDKDL